MAIVQAIQDYLGRADRSISYLNDQIGALRRELTQVKNAVTSGNAQINIRPQMMSNDLDLRLLRVTAEHGVGDRIYESLTQKMVQFSSITDDDDDVGDYLIQGPRHEYLCPGERVWAMFMGIYVIDESPVCVVQSHLPDILMKIDSFDSGFATCTPYLPDPTTGALTAIVAQSVECLYWPGFAQSDYEDVNTGSMRWAAMRNGRLLYLRLAASQATTQWRLCRVTNYQSVEPGYETYMECREVTGEYVAGDPVDALDDLSQPIEFYALPWPGQVQADYRYTEKITMVALNRGGTEFVNITGDLRFIEWDSAAFCQGEPT